MAEELSAKRIREIRSLIYNECSNFHFNNGCYYVACDVKSHKHPSKQCCFLCDTTTCKEFRKCKFFTDIVEPIEAKRQLRENKDKEAKLKYKEAIRKQQGISDNETGEGNK